MFSFQRSSLSSPGGDDLFILTNSEEFVKDVFELFSKFNHPGLHGADHGRMKLLLRQGLAPTAYLVYYCVKDMSRIFFKSLTQAAGRRSPRHHRCRCRGRPKGGPLWESREMLCSEIAGRKTMPHIQAKYIPHCSQRAAFQDSPYAQGHGP